MTSTHHLTDRDMARLLERRIDRFERQVQLFPGRRSNLGLGSKRALDGLGAALQQRAEQATVLRCLRFARDCSLSALAIGQPKPGTEDVTIDGRRMTIERLGSWSQSHVGHWRTAMFASLLLRDQDTSEWIARYPMEILRTTESTALPYGYTWVEALAGFRLNEHGWNARLAGAITEAEAERSDPLYVQEIALPAMRLLQVIDSDQATFTAALRDGLEAHVRHFTRGHERNDPQGFFSLPLAGLAAWGFDCGLELEVESEYLPGWLIRGRWEGDRQ